MEIGAKMATQQEKSLKNPNNGHKTRFFSFAPQNIRTLILSQSAFPRSVVHIGPQWPALVILSTLVCSGLHGSS